MLSTFYYFCVMNNKLFTDLILSVIESIIFLLFFVSLVFKKDFIKLNKIKCILFVIFYSVFTVWASSYLPMGMHTLFVTLFTILSISVITRTNVYNTTISVVLISVFIITVDILVSGIFMLALKMNLNDIMHHQVYYHIFTLVSKFIQVALTLLFLKFNNGRIKINIFKEASNQYVFFVMQLFIITLIIASINYIVGNNQNILIYNLLLTLLFILNLILFWFDLKERATLMNYLNKKRQLEEYVRNLEDVINVIRREKHDFMNHINTVFAICRLNKPDSLEMIDRYLTKLTNNLQVTYKFFETGNIYVDGLLAIKSNVCFENDIELVVDIGEPLHRAEADDSDVAGIVGNIVDNALESLLKASEIKNKKIIFKTCIEGKSYHMIISNNGPEIQKQHIDMIFDNGFTTKSNSKDHGFGLYITKQLILKNDGQVFVSSTPLETVFNIVYKVREAGYAVDSKQTAG